MQEILVAARDRLFGRMRQQGGGVELGGSEIAEVVAVDVHGAILSEFVNCAAFGWRPTRDIACQAPSSKTARPAASSMALQPITTSVEVTPLLRPNGRGAGPACALAANSADHAGEDLPERVVRDVVEPVVLDRVGAQRGELARQRFEATAVGSDCDIDVSIALDDLEFLQPHALVGDVHAVREMEFVAVPRADDVHVGLVEGLAVIDAVLVDQFLAPAASAGPRRPGHPGAGRWLR